MLHKLVAIAALAYGAQQVAAASAADWQKRTIYQVMTDRFALPPSQDSSGKACDTGAQLPCGGTWSGIENHLDYIQAMGFDAIWISPIAKQLQVPVPPPADGTAYHGYWPIDIYSLNTDYGSESDLQSLISAVHSRGMYIMVDVVVNHMATYNTTSATAAPTSPLAGISLNGYDPFNADSDYHPFCPITDYGNQTMVEQCWLGSAAVPLADVNTEDQTTVNTYYSWIGQVISNYTFDGLRIDTVKHIRKDFWPGFVKASGVWTLGEVLDGDAQYVGDYTNYVDAVFDYPGWGMVLQAFQTTGGSMSMLSQSIQNTSTYYKNRGIGVTGAFLENHDQPRFPSFTNDTGLIKNAISWSFIGDGVPVVYQGQEQEYTGGNVPNNREAIWLSAYEQNKPMFKHITSLNMARQAAMNGSSSFLSTPMKVVSTSTHSIAISKGPLLSVLSNVGQSGTNQVSVSVGSVGSGYASNSQLVEVLSCTSVSVDGSGNLAYSAQQGAPAVFLPSSMVNTKVCPNLAKSGAMGSFSGSIGVVAIAAAGLAATIIGIAL